ncbi:hypothetical protein L9F63_013613 [Diploptera punctata]|uniref:Gustatory receptor n=1 Tax=Diploptera punctata TaxID=6984 RepID=A0AAD8A9U6_DIPPU|nr:hypothetical protein L9F63_013613 [Diploptera punctata]
MKQLHVQSTSDYQALFFKTITSIYILSKILGLCPWSLQSNNGNVEFSASVLGITYTVIMFLVFLLWQIYIISWRIAYDYIGASFTYIVPQLVTICSSSLTALSALLVAVTIGRNDMKNLMYKISQVDKSMFPNNYVHYKKGRNVLTVEVIVLLLVTGALYGYDLVIWFGVKGDNYVIYRGLVYLINALTIMQYVNFVNLLQHRFAVLNKQINAAMEFQMNIRSKINHVDYTHSFGSDRNSVAPLEISNIFKDEISLSEEKSTTTNTRDEEIASIHKYREIYAILYDASCLINSIYGVQNLLQFITIFIVIVKGLYFLLTTLEDPSVTKVNSDMQFHAAMLVFLWAVYHALQLFWISISCHRTCTEANMTGAVVQKLILRKLDYETTIELNSFANQLLHTRILFTALGFFSVNLNVLCSISGAVMTYTIILNQASTNTNHTK